MIIKNLLYQTLYFKDNGQTKILKPKSKTEFDDSVAENNTIKAYLKEKYIKIIKK